METEVLTNNVYKNLKSVLLDSELEFDAIKIASAFFNYAEPIDKWLSEGKCIKLLVSLRPTTDYYALKKIMYNDNISIKFLKSDFHSKLIVLLRNDSPILSIIGSSNFTNGGLENNIETNLITRSKNIMGDIDNRLNFLWEKGYSLEISDMDKYKVVYDKFKNYNIQSEANELLDKLTRDRNKDKPKITISEAREYKIYWNYVNQIRDIVNDISQKEYPHIPVYLTIDHFWHWIKTVWAKENAPLDNPDETLIAKMFEEYCFWDKSNKNYTSEMKKISDDIFKKYLSAENIKNLDKDKLKEIYSNLHSGKERAIRFGADEDFVNTNDIEQIKESLFYLLYSNDDIEVKINNLCDRNGKYKLNEMNISTVQELIGWVFTEKYPIRNKKSNDALEMIGFKFKKQKTLA